MFKFSSRSISLTKPLPTFEVESEEALEPGPPGESLGQVFPLRRPVIAIAGSAINRFSVTQLINYQRCPRQYYFERVLRLPAADELAIWNNAEAPEPPSNINATLKGAVIHRFCERYTPDQNSEQLLRESFADVLRLRQAQLADRLVEINPEAAIKDLLPLAKNYLASDVFKRVESAREQNRSGEQEEDDAVKGRRGDAAIPVSPRPPIPASAPFPISVR